MFDDLREFIKKADEVIGMTKVNFHSGKGVLLSMPPYGVTCLLSK